MVPVTLFLVAQYLLFNDKGRHGVVGGASDSELVSLRFKPHESSCCLLEQETLKLLLSTGLLKEQIPA